MKSAGQALRAPHARPLSGLEKSYSIAREMPAVPCLAGYGGRGSSFILAAIWFAGKRDRTLSKASTPARRCARPSRSACDLPGFTRCGGTRGEVPRGKPVHHWNLRVVDTDSDSGARVRVGKDEQHSGDDHVHGRTCEDARALPPRPERQNHRRPGEGLQPACARGHRLTDRRPLTRLRKWLPAQARLVITRANNSKLPATTTALD